MSPNLAPLEAEPFKERKWRATNARIAAAAARLAVDNGIAGTTVEQIAEAAQVGRATFFRYYDAKEDAVAAGSIGPWLLLITDAMARQPHELSAMAALDAAFRSLAADLGDIQDELRETARLTRSSTALSAWTLQVYLRFEETIAQLAAPRFHDLVPGDPRPRLVGAVTMAAIRIALDDWVTDGGSLPQLLSRALGSVSVAS